MPQKFNTGGGNAQRAPENKSADSVGSNDNGNESQKRIVDKSAAVDGNLVETKKKGKQRGQNCMKPEEWREGNENSQRKSKRRSLRWIVQRKQTAKGGAKHFLGSKFQVPGCKVRGSDLKPETWNLKLLFEAIQSLGFVVVGVEHGQEFGDDQKIPNPIGKLQKLELPAIATDGGVVCN